MDETLSQTDRSQPGAVPSGPCRAPHGARLSDLDAEDLAAVLESVPEGLAVVDLAGTVMVVNRRLEQLSGYSAEQLAGRPVEALLPWPDRATHQRRRAEYSVDPRPVMMGEGQPLRLRRQDGSIVPVEISLNPGLVNGVQVVVTAVRDVSAKQELINRERLVTQALDAISDAVVVVDAATGRRLYLNRAVLDRTGYSREELVAIPIGAPSTDGERREIAAAMAAVVRGPDHRVTVDSHIQHRDGGTVPVEIQLSYQPEPSGSSGAGRVVLVTRDVGQRVATQRRLQTSEASFRAAFEQAPIGVAVLRLDPDGHHREILRANTALAEMLGETVDGLVGTPLSTFTAAEDETRDAAAASEMATGRRPYSARLKCYRRRDGSRLWAEASASLVAFPDLAGPTALLHIVDVTEQQLADRGRVQRAAAAELVARVVTAVLSGQHLSATYQEIVDGVAAVFEAENVTLELPDPGTEDLVILAAAGPLSSALRTGELPSTGPDATARFDLGTLGTGMITAARPPDREPFHQGEVELLAAVGRQLALAVQLGEARADQQRLAILEERQRLAQDLHDTVIQDLIAIGMQLHVDVQQIEDPQRQAGFLTVLEHLDAAIRRLRSTVFGLTAPDLER